MVLIQLINKYFEIFGISEQQLLHISHKSNARILVAFLVFGSCIFLNVAYLFLEVKSSAEFVECLYMAFVAFSNATGLTIIIWKIEKLFKFINDFENIIQESELKSIC